MDKQEKFTIEKEISYWNLVTLNSLKAVVGANARQALHEKPTAEDF